MKATVTTTLTAKITLEITEHEAIALLSLSGYSHEDFAKHVGKFAHSFDEKDPAYKGLMMLLESSRSLYEPLQEIKKIRQAGQNIKVV